MAKAFVNLKMQVEGIDRLGAQFDRLGVKFPKKYLTKAAREGSKDPLKQAKTKAPVDSGLLKRGLHLQLETPNKRNKAVYRMRWNAKYQDFYLKKSTGKYGGKPPKAYYPHSIEYGWKTAKGWVPGFYFVTDAVNDNAKSSLDKVTKSLNDSITTLIK